MFSLWVLPGFSSVLPQSKIMHLRSARNSELTEGVTQSAFIGAWPVHLKTYLCQTGLRWGKDRVNSQLNNKYVQVVGQMIRSARHVNGKNKRVRDVLLLFLERFEENHAPNSPVLI